MYFTQKVHFCQTLKKSIASISFFYYILCYFLCNCSCFCLVCLLFNVKISKHNRIGTQLACGYCYVTFPVVEVSSFKAIIYHNKIWSLCISLLLLLWASTWSITLPHQVSVPLNLICRILGFSCKGLGMFFPLHLGPHSLALCPFLLLLFGLQNWKFCTVFHSFLSFSFLDYILYYGFFSSCPLHTKFAFFKWSYLGSSSFDNSIPNLHFYFYFC